MALSKVDYNSINVTAAASKALKWNSSANGFETGDVGGSMVLLATETASSSATISFTSNIDSTYKEYIFKFYDIHPATNDTELQVGFRDGSTDYDATKTTTYFNALHYEDDSSTSLAYVTGHDQAQSTSFLKIITTGLGNDNDQSCVGELHLFDPASTTFVKNFYSRGTAAHQEDLTQDVYVAGYINTTTAIDGVQFKMSSGNIDAGVIKMYGVK